MSTTPDGRHGRVSLPYSGSSASGWVSLDGLDLDATDVAVQIDVPEHLITVTRGNRVLLRAPVATGRPTSPTPTGRYFVTDLVPMDPTGALGAFAFGLSGIQTFLPDWWVGGDQLAIHGTNDPASVGSPVSSGCLRVSDPVLERLRSLLRLGTPVVIRS
jgi:lipoprotein-anchoring transpeptidase ErfK/SrfK